MFVDALANTNDIHLNFNCSMQLKLPGNEVLPILAADKLLLCSYSSSVEIMHAAITNYHDGLAT